MGEGTSVATGAAGRVRVGGSPWRPTCRENVSARSVSTCPLGGSTISWDRRIRLEPWDRTRHLLVQKKAS